MEIKTQNVVSIEEADNVHIDINRLYQIAKNKIEALRTGNNLLEPFRYNDAKQFSNDMKETQRLLKTIQLKNNQLKSLESKIKNRSERQKIEINIRSHENQLAMLQKILKEQSISVREEIAGEERKALLLGRNGEVSTGSVTALNHEKRANRLQYLVSKMAEQVDSGEQAMSSLVHSSSVLGQTQLEYESQKGHILTGSKLLSKYEQREFTEKILLVFFFLFYFGVVYYILQKRVLLRFWIF